ncbi:hypothetical protein EV356DRAFT_502503 [Viridothelium virens]|uniref:DUF7924 domain-containing protein n=1 Tax=Viridothelium virens TaxID=1048519 RepID=A0A6A6H7W4_VIRVR|nr:hypothetical protein EV356DRAFT_502503 [Viridothelium virens]
MPPKKTSAKAGSGPQEVQVPLAHTSRPRTRLESGAAIARSYAPEKQRTQVTQKPQGTQKTRKRTSASGNFPPEGISIQQKGKRSPKQTTKRNIRRVHEQTRAPSSKQRGNLSKKSQAEPKQPPQIDEEVLGTIETAPADYQSILSSSSTATSTESLPWDVQYRTRQEDWYCRKGYLPELDDRTLEIIQIVLGTEPALRMARLKSDRHNFPARLRGDRNVHLTPHPYSDTYAAEIKKMSLNLPENRAAADVYSRLWAADIENCRGENEAIFQRTVMMSFLDRYRLIFGDIQGAEMGDVANMNNIGKKLAFSVEGEWTCDPMPTRALQRRVEMPFLTAPRPDLCVSFRTEDLIPNPLLLIMPSSMKNLVFYEGATPPFDRRAFGFFVVEGKRSQLPPDDDVALYQALNAASQALHNMFEFFREAEQQDVFFRKVRVFSATTNNTGLIIRIHRADKLDLESSSPQRFTPIPGQPKYDIDFKFEEYKCFWKQEFSRQSVIDTFAQIMVGYGEGVLYDLIGDAANKIITKLQPLFDQGHELEDKIYDYRHGQKELPSRGSSKNPQHSRQSNKGNRKGSDSASEIQRWAMENNATQTRRASNGTTITTAGDSGQMPEPSRTGVSRDFSRMMEDERPTIQEPPNKKTKRK